uniref:Uncharacterized protein n=1 Tax=Romanomermis culicivorax TaxID=13658 RepID=A0A915JMD3_ROMCU
MVLSTAMRPDVYRDARGRFVKAAKPAVEADTTGEQPLKACAKKGDQFLKSKSCQIKSLIETNKRNNLLAMYVDIPSL